MSPAGLQAAIRKWFCRRDAALKTARATGCSLPTARLPRGTGAVRYRCFLPDLTGFAGPTCTGPDCQQSTSSRRFCLRRGNLCLADFATDGQQTDSEAITMRRNRKWVFSLMPSKERITSFWRNNSCRRALPFLKPTRSIHYPVASISSGCRPTSAGCTILPAVAPIPLQIRRAPRADPASRSVSRRPELHQ